jgi:membrane protease YdiL (CAAX protease family)
MTSAEPSTGSDREPSDRRPAVALAGWLAIAGLQAALNFAARAGDETSSDDGAFYSWGFAANALVFYGILVALCLWLATGFGDRRDALGFRGFEWRWLGAAAVVVFGSVVLGIVLDPILDATDEQGFAPEEWDPDRAIVFAVNGAVAATIVPFAEELFFRGVGVRALGAFWGASAAVLGTAVAFGLAHGILVALPVLVPFALGLGYVRLRARSIWPCVIAHAAYNAVGVLVIYASLQ